MSRGPGKVQRFILEALAKNHAEYPEAVALDELTSGEWLKADPAGWLPVAVLARRWAAEQGRHTTTSDHTMFRRAALALYRSGQVRVASAFYLIPNEGTEAPFVPINRLRAGLDGHDAWLAPSRYAMQHPEEYAVRKWVDVPKSTARRRPVGTRLPSGCRVSEYYKAEWTIPAYQRWIDQPREACLRVIRLSDAVEQLVAPGQQLDT